MRMRALAANLAVLVLLGVGIPWVKGIEFLDLFLLIPYSLLGVLYTSPRAVAVAFEPPISLLGLGRAALVGWAVGALILLLGLLTVTVRTGDALQPPTPLVLCLLVWGLLACVVTAGVAVRVALGASTEAAGRGRIRIGFLLLLCLLIATPRLLGEERAGELEGWLTPERMVVATMVAAPGMAVGTLWLLRARMARYTD
jgi:hypothetical protein